MAAEARSWIERHEAEWLGRRGFDYFPYIDVHAAAHHRDLIGEADVDHAEGVLEKLHQLGDLGRTDGNHAFESLRVKVRSHFGAFRRRPSDHFGNISSLVSSI